MSLLDLSGDGGVLKELLSPGIGDLPSDGAVVDIHYVGRFPNGVEFDSSRTTGYPFTFELGKGKVIKGWDIAVKTMNRGERAIITIKPEYGYGEDGSPPEVPPNATLIFEVELVEVKSVGVARKKTDAVNADLVRLAEVRKQREEAAKKREDDKKAKTQIKAPSADRSNSKSPLKKGAARGEKPRKN